MALSLNRKIFLIVLFALSAAVIAQTTQYSDKEKDYKDRKSHENYRKRRLAVASWQINQLKDGALVVRLNTNHLLINAFKQRGLPEEAERARLQQAAINLNIIRAYTNKYKFSKVYFMYGTSSDSLRKGTRSGIFIDSTLKVNPSISMNEKFYLLAESDYVFNSSIGFVPEDSATSVRERGNPSSDEFPIVVKNKYGHQLKNPFPYSISKIVFSKGVPVVEMPIEGQRIPFTVTTSMNSGGNGVTNYKINGKDMELTIPRIYTYDIMSEIVREFDAELNKFYRESPKQDESDKAYQDSKPFFY
jgi:hypothetical protein